MLSNMPISDLPPVHARASQAVSGTTAAARDHWIDAARGISVLLVVLNHSVGWAQDALGMDTDFAARDFTVMLKDLRLPLLFFVAGLFAAKWAHVTFRQMFAGKLAFLVWPYIVWSVIVTAYMLGASFVFAGVDESPRQIVIGLLTVPVRPLHELWFLWVLVFCFILQRLLRRLPTAASIPLGLVCSVAATWLNDTGRIGIVPEPVKFVLIYGPFFLIAARLGKPIRSLMRIRTAQMVTLGYAVVWSTASFLHLVPSETTFSPIGQIVAIPAGIGLAVALQYIVQLRTVGADTLPVYTAHTTALVLIYGVVLLTAPGIVQVGWAAEVSPFAAAILAALTGVILSKYAGRSLLFKPPMSWRALAKPLPLRGAAPTVTPTLDAR
jgi:uncharacterized membrane protein YcfT